MERKENEIVFMGEKLVPRFGETDYRTKNRESVSLLSRW